MSPLGRYAALGLALQDLDRTQAPADTLAWIAEWYTPEDPQPEDCPTCDGYAIAGHVCSTLVVLS